MNLKDKHPNIYDHFDGNVYSLGLSTGGRPPKYKTPEELEEKCINYFTHCKNNQLKVNITGLVLYLGFSSSSKLKYYAEKGCEYENIVRRARTACLHSYENKGQPVDIFMLKKLMFDDSGESPISKGKITDDDIKDLTEEEKTELIRKIVS